MLLGPAGPWWRRASGARPRGSRPSAPTAPRCPPRRRTGGRAARCRSTRAGAPRVDAWRRSRAGAESTPSAPENVAWPRKPPRYCGRMPTQLKTRVNDLGDSRVRLDVEVEPAEVQRAVDRAAAALGRELKVPGFRKGKVPPAVVLRRVGRGAVVDEAVRKELPNWYEEAIGDAKIATVGEPSGDLADLPERGAPLSFSVEVAVRPTAELDDYKGLEVGRRAADVEDAEVDAELERLRESTASLETVDRPAASGDFVVIDFVGRVDGEPFEGGEARGHVLELGSGQLVEGFEEQLIGAGAGDEKQVTVTFPDDYRAEALAGKEA